MNEPGYYAIIPAAVRYSKKLEPHAKLLYGEITALANREGYCWATNRYFSELYDVEERSIQNWIKALKDEGFIDVLIEKVGIQTVRKIFINDNFKNISPTRKNFHPPLKNSSCQGENFFTHNNTMNTTYEKEEEKSATKAASPPSSKKTVKEIKVLVQPSVWITGKQEAALLKRVGSQEKLMKCYEKLSNWKIGKEITGGNDYLTICNWVIGAVEEDENKPKSNTQDKKNKDKEFSEKVIKQFKRGNFHIGSDYLEIPVGVMKSEYFRFGESGFSERVKSQLRKMNLDVSDL